MPDYTRLVLDELLRFRQAALDETVEFKTLKHNADLCPKVERQLNAFLDCSVKYYRVAYDVQGLRDRGTDVVLRYEVDEKQRFISLQIKSYDDLKEPGALTKLKAQVFEVMGEYGDRLEHFFLLLCTDGKEHADALRFIKKDFSPYPWVTVVDPTYAWTFLRLSARRIDAVVEAILKQDDAVFAAARRIVAERVPLELAILFVLVKESVWGEASSVSAEELLATPFIQWALERIPDWEREDFFTDEWDDGDGPEEPEPEELSRVASQRLAEALSVLDEVEISVLDGGATLRLHPEATEAFASLMLEAKVRLGYEEDELLEYMFESLNLDRAYGLDIADG